MKQITMDWKTFKNELHVQNEVGFERGLIACVEYLQYDGDIDWQHDDKDFQSYPWSALQYIKKELHGKK